MTDMAIRQPASGGIASLWADITTFFTSVRTTIGLLFLLAAASMVGTVIPQDVDLEQVRQASSPFMFRLGVILDLHKVYRSWWFLLLLGLLALNLLGCLLSRVPRIRDEWKSDGGRSSFSFTLSVPGSRDALKEIVAAAVSSVMRGAPRVQQASDGLRLVWDRHKVQLLAFPLIHSGIIVILLGGLLGVAYGVKGRVSIKEGEAASSFAVMPTGTTRSLPFEIAVDRFTLTRYPTGEPKEFRSDVRLLQNGKEVKKGHILVNHPMTFEGISLYQADYRMLSVKEVKLAVRLGPNEERELLLQPRQKVTLPGTSYALTLRRIDPGSTAKGAFVEVMVEASGEAPREVKIYRNDENPTELGTTFLRFAGYEPLYATGLQIGYDPGTNVVWIGCGLLVLGFFITLFTNHRGVVVELRTHKKAIQIRVSGRSKRLRREFRQAVEGRIRDAVGAAKS